MPSRPFEEILRIGLIEGGVSPRRARRIVDELDDHFESLRAELIAQGADEQSSVEIANQRLGNIDMLIERILADGDGLSAARRRPIAAFVLAPLPVIIAALGLYGAAGLGAAAVFIRLTGRPTTDPAFGTLATILQAPAAYGLTTLVAAWFCWIGYRCRCAAHWPLLTCAIISLFGAALFVDVRPPVGQPGTGLVAIGLHLHPNWARLLTPLIIFAGFRIVHRARMPRQESAV